LLTRSIFILGITLLAACSEAPPASPFPEPQRPVAPIVSSRYMDEDARDSAGEFETVMRLAEVRPGMNVADIGAGEGYYTVRLSPIIGRQGRVLAQDIVPQTIQELGRRVSASGSTTCS
jgi:predicted methyltransferase